MAPDDRTIEQAFHAALQKPAGERAAFLRQICGEDSDTAALVEALLASADAAEDFLETPAAELMVARGRQASQEAWIGASIGNYRIQRIIAAGGMGVVYEAEQAAPRRTVALKLLRRALYSQAAVQRFRREAELLGRLRHVGIAQVYEAGVHSDDGDSTPFFAMEFLAGALPLTQYAREKVLSVSERIDVLSKVCHALHYCHSRGVIHRDLKPGNILVTPAGEPKLIDFGVARSVDAVARDDRHTTDLGLVGSLAYMSPEQVGGRSSTVVNAQSDVYALGVVAYELFAGHLPLVLGDLPPLEAARVIRDEEPLLLGAADPRLRGDLETIVATAMAKDRSRRYPSVQALAQDLERFQRKHPIHARPPSRWYPAAMFARRHRALCALGAATAMVLVIGAAVSALFALRAERQRGIARRAEATARTEREAADYQAYVANIAAADAALRVHDVGEASRRLERAPERFRSWEWRFLRGRLDLSLRTLEGHDGIVDSVAFSPDGARLVTATGGWGFSDPIVRVWDPTTGALVQRLEGHTGGVGTVAFHPKDPYRLASASTDHTIRLWDLRSGATVATLPHPDHVSHAAFSADGHLLASVDAQGVMRLWNARTAELLKTLEDQSRRESQYLALLHNGEHVIRGGLDGALHVREWSTGRIVATMSGHSACVMAIAVSTDEKLIASASEDSTIRIWETDPWRESAILRGHTAAVIDVAFAPGPNRLLASTSLDNTVRLWRIEADQGTARSDTVAVLHGHTALPDSVAFSPDGSLLATGAADKTAKLWAVATTEQPVLLRGHDEMVRTLTFSPDGRWVASGAFDHTVRVWDVARRAVIATLDMQTPRTQTVAFHPRGHQLAAAGGGMVRLWDSSNWGEMLTLDTGELGSHALAYDAAGTRLASGGKDGTVRVWNPTTGGRLCDFPLESEGIEGLAFSPTTPLLFAGDRNGTIHVLDAATGTQVQAFNPGARGATMIAISPDGQVGASAHIDGTVRMWEVATGAELHRLIGHTAIVNAVAFNPDGSRLASGANDTTVRLWDTKTGEGLTTLRSHEHWVLSVAFSPDGTCIASGGGSYDGSDCTIRVWEAPALTAPSLRWGATD